MGIVQEMNSYGVFCSNDRRTIVHTVAHLFEELFVLFHVSCHPWGVKRPDWTVPKLQLNTCYSVPFEGGYDAHAMGMTRTDLKIWTAFGFRHYWFASQVGIVCSNLLLDQVPFWNLRATAFSNDPLARLRKVHILRVLALSCQDWLFLSNSERPARFPT